ncbi:MAG: EamA family transporter [Cytophagales bacterium]
MKKLSHHFTPSILISLLGVYVLWGTTYLAIKVLSHHVPLLLMATARQVIAGIFMIIWAFLSKHKFPSIEQIKNTSVVGFFLLVIGNALVLWSNYFLNSSGVVAVLVATTPFWLTLLEWLWFKSERPKLMVWIGVFLGLLGVYLLSDTTNLKTLGSSSHIGIGMVILGTFSWSFGTLYAKVNNMPESSFFSSGFQMLFSSSILVWASFFIEDWHSIEFEKYNTSVWVSFIYLIIGGSILGFTAFTYLAKNTKPSITGTYAYVNPVIALLAGYFIGHETFTQKTLIASFLLLFAVALIVSKPEKIISQLFTKFKPK